MENSIFGRDFATQAMIAYWLRCLSRIVGDSPEIQEVIQNTLQYGALIGR